MTARLISCVLMLVVFAGAAEAQQRAVVRPPANPDWAAAGEFGMYRASDPVDHAGMFGVQYENYLDARKSARASFAWMNPHFKNSGDSLRQTRLGADMVYNWDRGNERIKPFAGAGAGLYFFKYTPGGRPDLSMSRTRLGLHMGGGAEYFMTPLMSVKGEMRYHAVGRGDLPWKLSGLDFTVGVKRYF